MPVLLTIQQLCLACLANPIGGLKHFLLEDRAVESVLAAADHSDDARDDEPEYRNLAAVRPEASWIRIQVRPGPYWTKPRMYAKVSDNHGYAYRARA